MSVKTADVLSPYRLSPWHMFPGNWFLKKSSSGSGKAEVVFRNFVQHKVPQACTLLTKLIDTRHISPIHLPLSVYAIFLTYIDEQIELYQNQKEERDPVLDLKWQEFKEALSKERITVLRRNSKWAAPFFDDLKDRLKDADLLQEADFETTLSLWVQIIGIAHIGDMHLASLFEKKAASHILHSKIRQFVYTDLPRRDLMSCFYLTLGQISQDCKWIAPKIMQKMRLPEDPSFRELFDISTDKSLDKICQTASTLERDFKQLLKDLFLLNLTDNEAIKKMLIQLEGIIGEEGLGCFAEASGAVEMLQYAQASGKPVDFSSKSGREVNCSQQQLKPLLSFIENYQECHLWIDAYFNLSFNTLSRLLESLQKSNEALEKYQTEGIVPCLASSSILPAPSLYDEKVVEELLASASPRSKNGHKKTKKSSHQPAEKKQPEKAASPPVSEKKTNEKSKRISLEPQTPLQNLVLDPLEQLREKMFQIRQGNPSPSLRQALWHLDALISIQQLLDTKSVKAEESLTIFDAVVSSAQKLLEQTYRFCGGSSQTTHNLKTCHSVCSSFPYPEIVKELYLANHWTRYFYIEQQKWHSISTQDVQTPPLLEELVKLAEGIPFSPQELQRRVKTLIEKTCRQVQQLLPQTALAPLDRPLAKEVAIQWKTPIEVAGMETVKNSLKAFLADSDFAPQQPVYLYIKQAIAALAMCKDSLARIQAARTPRELATWTSWCLQQVQEGIENVLDAIEYLQNGEASMTHNLKTLSEKVGLKMGDFGEACDFLSYKPRYPVEISSEGLGARIIDDVEAFKHHPECLEGFQIVGSSPFLWKMPSQGLSLDQMGARLESFIKQAEAFLRTQAVPLLLESMKKVYL